MDGLLGVAGMVIDSYCGSFPHSLLSTSKNLSVFHPVQGIHHWNIELFPPIMGIWYAIANKFRSISPSIMQSRPTKIRVHGSKSAGTHPFPYKYSKLKTPQNIGRSWSTSKIYRINMDKPLFLWLRLRRVVVLVVFNRSSPTSSWFPGLPWDTLW
jgi:hypothetical protein